MKIGIINKSKNSLPTYKTPGSSGMDLRANDNITLFPGERRTVSTGIYLETPKGIEAQIRPRSGLAIKHGVTVLNTPGTIDSDYRGEVLVILINLSDREFKINTGDRIAQIVFSRVENIIWKKTIKLTKTKRGEGGFGSTGIN